MAAADAANAARLYDAARLAQTQGQQSTVLGSVPITTIKPASSVPGAAAVAQQQYQADLAAAAAQNFAQRAAAREVFSQGITQAQGGAADIYGGRAPALLGQAVTGTQRNLLINQAAEELRYQAAQEALRRAYSEAVGTAYTNLATSALQNANDRSIVAAQIKKLGLG